MLRRAVCEALIRKFSRQNAFIGLAFFVPGADLPVLTLNQVRLVLRIADAYGFEIDKDRAPEVLAVIGSGLGFRSLARRTVGVVPDRRLGAEGRRTPTSARARSARRRCATSSAVRRSRASPAPAPLFPR